MQSKIEVHSNIGIASFQNWTAVIVTAALATVVVAIWLKIKRKQDKYLMPSGPQGLPVIGNILSLVVKPFHLKLSEWVGQFGDMYTIHLGPTPAVILNDVVKMREILGIYPASTGKLLTETFVLPFEGKYGIFCADEKEWAEQRNFCAKNLKIFGLGKGATIEPMILDEVSDFMAWLEKEGADNQPVQILKNMQKATFNTLWTLVTGEKIPLGDSRFADLMENFMNATKQTVHTGLAFLPWLKYIAPEKSGFRFMLQSSLDAIRFIKEYFDEHQGSYQEGSPRDLIDAYIEQIRNEKDPNSSFYGDEGRKHAVASITSLFFGGGETTASNINWLIFYLCCSQEAQRKLHEEIDRVVGRDRDPSLKDKLDMPYTDAVIHESLRKCSFAPFGLFHQLTEDTSVEKYFLPKGTLLIANLYHAQHSPATWGDPEAFRPERFLARGDNNNLKDNVVAFQVGRRQCMGEGLARDIMFLFVTKLFQTFHFKPDPSQPEENYLLPDTGICLTPKHVPVVLTPRYFCKKTVASC